MMRGFEFLYLFSEPFLPPLHKIVRRQLADIAQAYRYRPEILDVGGRKSHYTIGVPAYITVTDLPRETEIQAALNLGFNQGIVDALQRRRSNIKRVLLDDMTRSALPDGSFDCVVAVEVLEHVEADDLFVQEVHRVLKPEGVFLLTTPNGDFVRNTNPDHKRHYTREQLRACLSTCFWTIEVEYAIRSSWFSTLGLQSWSIRHPGRTALSMIGNFVNSVQSSRSRVKDQSKHTGHLFAMARKERTTARRHC